MKKRSMVICEGESDQIILSYYFINQFHYEHTRRLKRILDIKPSDSKNETEFVDLYTRAEDGDEVVIWAIGGKKKFGQALQALLEDNQINAPNECYSRVLVITDNDSKQETENLWKKLNERLGNFGISAAFPSSQWVVAEQTLKLADEPLPLKLLGIAVPPDKNGAMETFLLNALAEKENNQYLAEESKSFVKKLIDNKDKIKPYLSKRGLRIKAPLAVFFAIASPGRIYEEMKHMLLSVEWKKYKEIQTGFRLLDDEFAYKGEV